MILKFSLTSSLLLCNLRGKWKKSQAGYFIVVVVDSIVFSFIFLSVFFFSFYLFHLFFYLFHSFSFIFIFFIFYFFFSFTLFHLFSFFFILFLLFFSSFILFALFFRLSFVFLYSIFFHSFSLLWILGVDWCQSLTPKGQESSEFHVRTGQEKKVPKLSRWEVGNVSRLRYLWD